MKVSTLFYEVCKNRVWHLVLSLVTILMISTTAVNAQTQLAAWSFPSTQAAPNTPTSYLAEFGEQVGTAGIYADGSNGSSTFSQSSNPELTNFAGSTINDPKSTPANTGSISIANSSANGKSIVIKLSTLGYENPVVTYATRGTSTGFTTHTWAYSTDGTNFTNASTITGRTSTSYSLQTVDLTNYDDVDDAVTVYLKITFTGATNATGNNRVDNFQIHADELIIANPPVVSQELYLGTVNVPASFQIVATNSPTSYAIASGTLPQGLNLNTTTGEISGTPEEAGYFELDVNATNNSGTSADELIAISIDPGDQTITFGALSNVTFGDAPFNLTGTASSGLSVSYSSSNPLVANISGNTVTIVGAGSTTITASQNGDANWNPALNVQQTLTVDKADQTITFDPLADVLDTDPDFNLTATSTSGLTITYNSSNPAVATISGNTVSIIGVGTTTITASQAGDDNYNAATPVDQTLTVNNSSLQNQTITFNALSDVTYGDAPFNLTATASSGLTVTYTSSDDNVASVSGNTVTIHGVGTVTITASQAGNGTYNPAPSVDQSFEVLPKNLTVSGLIAEDKVYDGTVAATLDFSGATLVGVVGGDDVSLTGTAEFVDPNAGNDKDVITALTLPGIDAANYSLTQPTLTASILPASQTITFDPLSPKTTADAPFALTATASSGLTVEYTSSNPLVASISGNTVTINGSGTTTITASQPGNSNINAATPVDQLLTVTAAPSTVLWTFTGPSAAPSGVPSGVAISDISRGNVFGPSPNALLTTTSPSSGYTGVSGTVNAGTPSRTGALDVDLSAYFEFTVTPDNGKIATLSDLSFGTRSTSTAPQAFTIRSSKDGFTSDIMTGSINNNSVWSLKSGGFTTTNVAYSNPVTFRIYGHSGTGNAAENTTNWRIDDLSFEILVDNMPVCGTPEAGTATNNGSAAFCVSGSTSLEITGYTNPDEIDGISIQWYSSTDNVDFQPVLGANSPVLQTGVLTQTTYFYAEVSCSVSNETDISNTLTVTVNPLPVAEISGNLSYCTGGSTTLTASAGDSYQWYDVNGIMVGETNNTLNVTVAGSYYVEVTTNGCSANSSVVNVTETSAPAAPVVSGPTNVCPFLDTNEEVAYTIDPVPGATSYNWTVPPSVSIVSGQGTTTLTVTIGMNLMNSANKQIRVTASNDCGTSPMTIFYMLVQAPQTLAQIDGPTDACDLIGSPTPVTYSIPPVTAATSYLWTVPAGVTIVNDNGASIDVTFDNTFVTDAITVRALNNCGVSNARAITVSKTNPSAPGLITGPTSVCMLLPTPQNPSGVPATYSVNTVGNNTYVWSVPNGATITNQGTTPGTSFIEVSFDNTYTNGNIGVYAVNGCGNSSLRTLKLTRLRPEAPSGIDVTEVQTCPGRLITYSLSVMPSNANYVQWTIPANGTIVSGQGTSSITVSYDDAAIDGNVTATGVNGCQNSSTRTLRVKLSACEAPPPPAPFVQDGNVKGVIGTSVKALNATIFPNPTTDVFRMKVDATGTERVQVSVFDVTGRPYTKLVAQPGQTITFGNELKPGAYLVELVQGANRKVVKVIKN